MITEKFGGMTKGKKRDAKSRNKLINRQLTRSQIEDKLAEIKFKREMEL